tara:strand:- start:2194 stop:2448 length:255 start_codon:yes stop_codon:yes gene_type:complete
MSAEHKENLQQVKTPRVESIVESNVSSIRDVKIIKKDERINHKVNIDNLLRDLRAEQKKDRRTNVIISCTLLSAIAGAAILFNN